MCRWHGFAKWQCRGQSCLLLVLSKDNVLLQSSLCQTAAEQMMTMMTMMATYYCVLLNMLCFSGTASCELEECPSFAYICP